MPIDSRIIRNLADDEEISVKYVDARAAALSQPVSNRLLPLSERFIVATRGVFQDGEASTIATVRRVPVLVIEPTKADRSPEVSGTAAK
jgi:hypothetical protein